MDWTEFNSKHGLLLRPYFALTQSMAPRWWAIAHDCDTTIWVNTKHGMYLIYHDLNLTQNMAYYKDRILRWLNLWHYGLRLYIAHDCDATDWVNARHGMHLICHDLNLTQTGLINKTAFCVDSIYGTTVLGYSPRLWCHKLSQRKTWPVISHLNLTQNMVY